MHLDTELSKAMEAAGQLKEYDDNIKALLSQKIILAHILAGAVKEFFQIIMYPIRWTRQEKGIA